MQPNEYPHALYIANYSTAASTCLKLKRWLFDTSRDLDMYTDPVAVSFLFCQAVEDVNRGYINAKDKLYQLKALQESNNQTEV